MAGPEFLGNTEKTEVMYGERMAIHSLFQVISKANSEIILCLDSDKPSFSFLIDIFHNREIIKNKSNVKKKCIIEITPKNVDYCRSLSKLIEFRHLDKIETSFAVNESECVAIATVKKEKGVIQIVYSNLKPIVQQQNRIFEIMWNNAIPYERKVKEIENGTTESEKTEVLYGKENALGRGVRFMKNVTKSMDIYFDSFGPSVVVGVGAYRNGYIDIRNRGGKIRAITEITKENIHSCKELMTMVDDLRHFDRLMGSLAISQTEILTTTIFKDSMPSTQIIYSSVKELVEQGQYIFDIIWNNSIPAREKIREIEQGEETERTEIIEGSKNIHKLTIERFSKMHERADCCYDSTIPTILPTLKPIIKTWIDFVRRGGKIRIVTEINRKNLSACKELMNIADIRHLNGIRGNFVVSERDYFGHIVARTDEPVMQAIHSTARKFVEEQRHLFQILWEKSIPIQQRIREIELEVEPPFLEVITNNLKSREILIEITKSAKKEVLLVLPNDKALTDMVGIGIIDYLVDASRRGAHVKIICPITSQNLALVERLRTMSSKFVTPIRIMNGIISQSGIIIVDGSQFFTAELRNPYALSFLDSLGLGLYSNSINFISLLKSFFEALWTESELHQQLEFYNRMQKEFISIAAHELRTPIQPILGLAQILYKKYGSANEENAQFLSVIIRNAKRLYEITENIIDVARIENHSLVPLKEEVDLTELVEDAISNTKELFSSKGIQVSFTSMVPQVFINADRKRILQVLLNLLNNASRFTDKGEISIKLEIKDKDKNEKAALIFIKDTGRGIDSEIFPRLFTKFSSKPAGGTGLGLYIAKSIVEAHDGRIWAENNKDGSGATFCFSIPFAK